MKSYDWVVEFGLVLSFKWKEYDVILVLIFFMTHAAPLSGLEASTFLN